ncbi:MAG: hypothetical protein IIT51_09295 [Oscillospiraceae bacterium]|nr:hypothetical protein [Oscillospiraceae bacterium]
MIAAHGRHCFVTVLLDETLLTYYGDFRNDAERSYYEEHRKSPYCHFVQKQFRDAHSGEPVLRLTVLAEPEQITALQDELTAQLCDTVRMTCLPADARRTGHDRRRDERSVCLLEPDRA